LELEGNLVDLNASGWQDSQVIDDRLPAGIVGEMWINPSDLKC
jgi:hypothetical protein